MSVDNLRKWIGYPLIVYHIAAMLGCLLAGYNNLEFKDRVELVFFISPIFTVYTSTVFKVLLQGSNVVGKKPVDLSIFTIIIAHLFGLYINGLILVYFVGILDDVRDLKLALGLSETIFGLYLGNIIYAFFAAKKEHEYRRK